MAYYITADVQVQFRIEDEDLDSFLDQETGAVNISRVADALDARLEGRESHYLRVLTAEAV